jgi:hypothetical protein
MKEARELASEHEATAKRYAGQLEDATKNFAPHEPGVIA